MAAAAAAAAAEVVGGYDFIVGDTMRSVLLRRFKLFFSLSLSTCDDACGFKLLCWCAWWNDWWLKKIWAGCLSHGNPYAVNSKKKWNKNDQKFIQSTINSSDEAKVHEFYPNGVVAVATYNPSQSFVIIESMEQSQLELWRDFVARDLNRVTLHSWDVNNLHLIILMNAHSSDE